MKYATETNMTPIQTAILTYLRSREAATSPPTIREIAMAVAKSTSVVWYNLRRLELRGAITIGRLAGPGSRASARQIRLAGAPTVEELAASVEELEAEVRLLRIARAVYRAVIEKQTERIKELENGNEALPHFAG